MKKIYYVGMDVRKETVALSIYQNMEPEPFLEKISPNDSSKLIVLFKQLQKSGKIKSCYEVGCMVSMTCVSNNRQSD